MLRVHVKNFQSIAQSTVDIDGLTVVTGPNNSGKTALMRAIRGVFTNAKGSNFVRHGTDACEVTVEFPDGNVVTWEKGKTLNRYTVNGKLLDKVGQGVPDEVEALGIVAIQAGNQTVWPQIAPQFTGQVFLLDQAGSVVAESLADVERVGKLSRALKTADSDRRQVASELKVRRADQKALVTEMAAFDGLDDAVTEITAVEQDADDLKASLDRLTQLDALSTRLTDYQQQVDKLAGIRSVDVPPATQHADIVQTGDRLATLSSLRDRLTKAKDTRAKYEGAQSLPCPTTVEVQSVQDAKQELKALETLLESYAAAKGTHAKLADFTAPDLDMGKTERTAKALEIVKKLKGRQDAIKDEQDGLNEDLVAMERELVEAKTLVSELLAQFPACPTCGQGHAGCQ